MKFSHDIVMVTWDDAGELGLGWQQDDQIKPSKQLARTIGFLLAKTREHLVIASTVDDAKASVHHFQIPRKMIQKLEIYGAKGSEIGGAS